METEYDKAARLKREEGELKGAVAGIVIGCVLFCLAFAGFIVYVAHMATVLNEAQQLINGEI